MGIYVYNGRETDSMLGDMNEQAEKNVGKMKGRRIFLLVSSAVFIAALVVCAFLLLGAGNLYIERVLDYNAVIKGVYVNGIDISRMTEQEAKKATKDIHKELLSGVKFTLNVNNELFTYSAVDFNVSTDYEDIFANALSFGRSGSFVERKMAYDTARSDGKDFTVSLRLEEGKLRAALADIKKELDRAPLNAAAIFMPNGYTLAADGTPLAFEPDPKAMADAHSRYKEIKRPAGLVRITADQMPNKLRFQYWETDHYEEKDNIPADANISRFIYTPEVTGIDVDTEAICDHVMNAVSSDDFSTITVPVKVTEAELKIEDIKEDTQLIASWTSCYKSHKGANRNWNVSRMSSFINGVVIDPGEEWSINTEAGPRNAAGAKKYGWKKAAGIENGGYTQQYGGGVCQLGSTTYNAAIRAGLYIVTSTHHTIPSDYVPLGLDATLSTPKPDLILRNDNTMPVYLVSYVDPKKMTVTVEVYGQLPVDPQYGEGIIYNFTSDNKGKRYGSPSTKVISNKSVAPDGTVIDASNPNYVYAKPRAGTQIQTYKHILSADGTPLCDPIPFEFHKYPVINGITYVYTPPKIK